ncbi:MULTISPECIES: helix-turn-helix transcriptional regulator [Flavobacterium]|uniref:Transcriptional regulator n=1 Tax=Flavobacterium salmonis TaxID=2654844 RepID=A0A6V6Z6E4_9FLAO|nr:MULTISPECIES: helix-turn-helix transcriptional regulator [Flavobacterium]OOV17720.1 transcriptional regulator [Flavobacterium sp. LM4]CAD0007351.1 transcriptional regulator [Flavobacterium salmonis]
MSSNINDNIRSIRELKNYTQEYMAVRLGITQAGYSKIEKGNAKMSFEKLEEIAAVFELSVENIISFETNLHITNTVKRNSMLSDNYGLMNLNLLYQDKIMLLEKLLHKTDSELRCYKDKFGLL